MVLVKDGTQIPVRVRVRKRKIWRVNRERDREVLSVKVLEEVHGQMFSLGQLLL
jgi:hypothetical protein